MGEVTNIGWTDHTFNPWMGCAKVSPACTNCYAESLTVRFGKDLWGKNAARQVTVDGNWRKPIKWNRDAEAAGRRALVFCASLADVFEDRADLVEPRGRLFELIESTPHLIWLLLTKRPGLVLDMVPARWTAPGAPSVLGGQMLRRAQWPSNVWVGTTVEDQKRADERVPELLQIPAPVRFLSMEPLLGPVKLDRRWLLPDAIVCARQGGKTATAGDMGAVRSFAEQLGGRFIDWVIVGGESGPGFRPLNLDHAREIRDQVLPAGVPLFFKQVGGLRPTDGGALLDGETWHEFPVKASR